MKKWLRKWLGVAVLDDDVMKLKHQSIMTFDIGYYDPTVIILATALGGGRVKIIHCHSGIKLDQLMNLEKQLQGVYGRQVHRIIDAPMGGKRRMKPL